MSFTQRDVEKLAHLARLAISNDKSFDHSIVEDLSNILQLVSKISEINTTNVTPMEHSLDASQRCRPDTVTEPDVRTAMQKIAPANSTVAGLYLVPKVVE